MVRVVKKAVILINGRIKVWTKQHKNILSDLERDGRYLVKKEYIEHKMEEHSGIYLEAYFWLYQAVSKFMHIPADAKYPVWVSLAAESSIPNSDGNVVLEMLLEQDQLMVLDLEKWGYIVNYMYIPAGPEDRQQHDDLLKRYGIDDCTAYMSHFYPGLKSKIVRSWNRLFDKSIELGQEQVGIIWEVHKEWIVRIER